MNLSVRIRVYSAIPLTGLLAATGNETIHFGENKLYQNFINWFLWFKWANGLVNSSMNYMNKKITLFLDQKGWHSSNVGLNIISCNCYSLNLSTPAS